MSEDDIDDIKKSLNVSFNPDVNIQTIPASKAKKKSANCIRTIDDDGADLKCDFLDFDDLDELKNEENKEDENIKDIILEFDEEEGEGWQKESTPLVILKKPEEVYYELYRSALEKAEIAKKQVEQLYLDAEEIKQKYGLE